MAKRVQWCVNVFKAISAIGATSANRIWMSCGLFWALTGWLWSVVLCWIDPLAAAVAAGAWISLWILGFYLSWKSK